ncbi:MAG: hypothetical protein HRU02_18275 [Myxococcales bacterium]|nr:hypothetical protein [Myxococcales bacterium]
MTTGTHPSVGAPASPSVWLYGRGVDLTLGYGLGYLVCVPLLVLLGAATDHEMWFPLATLALALVSATPHYGATLLRVYEERDERRKYAIFAVWITLVLAALFVVGLYDRWVGSALLTVYASWSPWHFSGQNYGVAMMYLRRNGIGVSTAAKRSLYASFVSSAVLAFVVIHNAGSSLLFAQGASDESHTFGILQLGIPAAVGVPLASALLLFWLGSVVRFFVLLAPRPKLGALLPVVCLIAIQSLWFLVPSMAGALSARYLLPPLPFAVVIISTAHSIQYLWVTSYYAGLSRSAARVPPFLGKCLLAGSAISVPALLFVPGLFGGSVPNSAGIFVLSFSIVNIHHFILDGAIWKLRDGRVARALLRAQPETPDTGPVLEPRRRWLRPVLLGIGAVGFTANLAVMGFMSQSGLEATALHTTTKRLAWLGRDTPQMWTMTAAQLEQAGHVDAAIDAWRSSLGPGDPPLVNANRLAWLLINHRADDPESLREATALATYLTEQMGNERAEGLQTLAAAHFTAERYGLAIEAAGRAFSVVLANGNPRRIQQVKNQLRSYRAAAQRAGHVQPR